jgi:antirestriction protein ArdC
MLLTKDRECVRLRDELTATTATVARLERELAESRRQLTAASDAVRAECEGRVRSIQLQLEAANRNFTSSVSQWRSARDDAFRERDVAKRERDVAVRERDDMQQRIAQRHRYAAAAAVVQCCHGGVCTVVS